jgi:hypothetical protein
MAHVERHAIWWNEALAYFTRSVLDGRTREVRWVSLLNMFFAATTEEDSWAQLNAWAADHGIRYVTEERGIGKKIWIIFSVS